MLALAAARFGLHCHVFSPEKDSCAFDVVREKTCASFEDEAALARFANHCDIITFEFENVPADTADFLVANKKPVLPDPGILATTQDRLAEKHFLTDFEIKTAPYAEISSDVDISVAIVQVPAPAVMKTRRLGYDGKGQVIVRADAEIEPACLELGGANLIAEAFVPFDREVSILAVRGRNSATAFYPLVENQHRDGILRISRAPAPDTSDLQAQAERYANDVLQALDYVGVLAIEFFVN
ncbi:MAG TPA: ATP-grasp domain-containing protein, partial [Xanthobacteraceae bacterium]|nr:ATP-grasp domain-containing protein [Xanthobacteraceae bacterium]